MKFRLKSDYLQGSIVPKSDESPWFCSRFQRNRYVFKESHVINVKGRVQYAKHICASCWQKDKKELNHSHVLKRQPIPFYQSDVGEPVQTGS